MKLGERWFDDDGKIIQQRTFDPTPQLEEAKALRDVTGGHFGESRHIGRVPMWLVNEWLKEAGVSWDDPAADDVIFRKLTDGDVSKFRVWQGTY